MKTKLVFTLNLRPGNPSKLLYLKLNTRLACGGEYSPDDAAQSHQELPQRHVLLADRHHQRAGVVLHKDAGNAVTARCVVYHPLLEKRNNTVRSQVSV